jgi:DnaJ-domain-containing protein 1
MGQMWDRINRLVRSYSLGESHADFPRSGRSFEESDEDKLRRMIDELESGKRTRQPYQQHLQSVGNAVHKPAPMTEQETRKRLEIKRALEVLGLPPSAHQEVIKNTYKKLMMQYHPDRVMQLSQSEQASAKEKAARVNQAYQFLKEVMAL